MEESGPQSFPGLGLRASQPTPTLPPLPRLVPCSGAAALTYPQQPKKLSTPNKDGSTAGSKVPLLKLPSSVAAGPSAVAGAIEAAPAPAQDSQPQVRAHLASIMALLEGQHTLAAFQQPTGL